MDITKILNVDFIKLDLVAKNKDEALKILTEILYEKKVINSTELFLKDVYIRESEGITGIGNSIAIPHGKSRAVIKTSIIMARNNEFIQWESLDEKPVKFIILFAVRDIDKTTVHLKLLSQIAMKLADDEILEKLLTCSSEKEIIELFK